MERDDLREVVTAEADLGVLFVHGIGDQKPGETVIQGTDPLCAFIKPFLEARKRHVALEFPTATLKAEGSEPAHVYATLLVTDGSQGEPESAEADGVQQVHRTTVLFAEAYWADAFVAQPQSRLGWWLPSIVPAVVGRHFGVRAARAWRRGDTAGAVGRILQLELFWLASPLIIAVLVVLNWVWLVPIAGLRDQLYRLQLTIAGTLGDSFALLFSRLNEVSIRTRILRSLDWMVARSGRVVVVAHSQGAAVAVQALCAQPCPKVSRLVTYGPGIRKLSETSTSQERGERSLAWLGMLALPLLVLLGWAFVTVWLEGHLFESIGALLANCLLLLLCVVANVSGLKQCLMGPELEDVSRLADQLAQGGVAWTDLFATHDPVPNGSLSSVPVKGLEQVEVANQRSVLLDHNSYWQNIDQFVPAVAARIFSGLPGPLGTIIEDADGSLRRASLGRFYLADLVTVIRAYLLAGLALPLFLSTSWIQSVGSSAIGFVRGAHAGLIARMGEDVVAPLPVRLGAYPYQLGVGLVLLCFWLLYKGCMASWRHSVRQNWVALITSAQEVEAGLTWVVVLPGVVFLFILIANERTLGEDVPMYVYFAGVVASVVWPLVRSRRRRASRRVGEALL